MSLKFFTLILIVYRHFIHVSIPTSTPIDVRSTLNYYQECHDCLNDSENDEIDSNISRIYYFYLILDSSSALGEWFILLSQCSFPDQVCFTPTVLDLGSYVICVSSLLEISLGIPELWWNLRKHTYTHTHTHTLERVGIKSWQLFSSLTFKLIPQN